MKKISKMIVKITSTLGTSVRLIMIIKMILLVIKKISKMMVKITSTLGTSVRAPVMKEHWIDCCIMSPRLTHEGKNVFHKSTRMLLMNVTLIPSTYLGIAGHQAYPSIPVWCTRHTLLY